MVTERKQMIQFLKRMMATFVCSIAILWILGMGVLPRHSYVKSQYYEYYNGENYDTLFVGSSVVYRSINPEIIDARTGSKSFNLGTSSQKPLDSYFVIKDAIRSQNIQTVILDVSQNFYIESPYTTQNKSTYLIYDRMEDSEVKKEYFLSAFSFNEYPFAALKVCHYDFPSGSEFLRNLKASLSPASEPRRIVYDNEWYEGRGFVPSNQVYKGDASVVNNTSGISENAVGWLKKTIELCQENSIRLLIVSAPKTQENNIGIIEYQKNYEYLSSFLDEYGLAYYDFSMMEEYASFANEHFVDAVHLNGVGAAKYSEMIAGLMNN